MAKIALSAFLLLFFVQFQGCLSLSIQDQKNHEGNQAFTAHSYRVAYENYRQALDAASSGHDSEMTAVAMYGLARASVELCRFDEGEDWFKKSIILRESLPQRTTNFISQNRVEYSRLLLAQHRYAEGILQIESAMPMLERMGAERWDPIGYANFLDYYAAALRAVSREADARLLDDRADFLRKSNPNALAKFVATPIPENCDSSDK